MWSQARRFAFRFFAAFVVLENFPWPLGSLPRTRFVKAPFRALGDVLVPWFARHVLGSEVTRIENGSGDTRFHWAALALTLVASLLIAILWSAIDRKRTDYGAAFRWLRVYVRLLLASAMISYGIVKVLGGQFPGLDAYRLVEPLGQMSPMGLLWTAMGFSPAWQIFAGVCELAAGLLLLWGRTASAGALVATAVLANVVVVNFCFDVPVKIYSVELLVYALFVLLPDLPLLASALLLRREATLAEVEPLPAERSWLNRLARAAVLVATAVPLVIGWQSAAETWRWLRKGPFTLAGVWAVEKYEGPQGSRAWRKIAISNWGAATVQYGDDSVARVSLTTAGWDNREVVLLPREPAGPTINGIYEQPAADTLIFRLSRETAPVVIRMKRADLRSFPLVLRGFHWVNDAPFNR